LKQLKEQPLPWATVEIDNDNLFKWICVINGPDNTPYEGGQFKIELDLPADYPFKAPKVFFKTKTYHPNIQQKDGAICNAILVDSWSPQLKIHEVLLIIRQMLAEPNIGTESRFIVSPSGYASLTSLD